MTAAMHPMSAMPLLRARRVVVKVGSALLVDAEAGFANRAWLETLAADVSERGATRMDDRTSDASMERRKKEGYF